MLLDIVILLILVFCCARGYGKGFVKSALMLISQILGITVAFIFTAPISKILLEGPIGGVIKNIVLDKTFGSNENINTILEGIPLILKGGINSAVHKTSDVFAGGITNLTVSIITFTLLMLMTTIIVRFLLRGLINRKSKKPLFIERIIGLIIGGVIGIIVIFVFLAFLAAGINFLWEGASQLLVGLLDGSIISRSLYDNNLLLLITNGMFS